jgi:tetratricopeptide (TPR) repeat protein
LPDASVSFWLEQLKAGVPDDPALRAQWAITKVVVARVRFFLRGKPDEALDGCGAAIPVLEQDVKRPSPQESSRKRLTHAYCLRATILQDRGRHEEALADWDRALADPTLPQEALRYKCRMNRVYVLAHLGRWAEACDEVERLTTDPRFEKRDVITVAEVHALCARAAQTASADERVAVEQKYAARAVKALREMADAGVLKGASEAEKLRDNPDFSALRGRADFEALLARLRGE